MVVVVVVVAWNRLFPRVYLFLFCRRGKYVLNAQFPCLIKNTVRSIKREK